MRGSLILLAAFLACSDSSGPPHAPILTTKLSATAGSINGGALVVTLNVSNPTDTTEQIAYWTPPAVYAEIKLGGQWRAGYVASGFGGTDTMVLPSGVDTTLGAVDVLFTPSAVQSSLAPAALIYDESFAISPGMYDVRACFAPPGSGAPECGNGVSFDLTP